MRVHLALSLPRSPLSLLSGVRDSCLSLSPFCLLLSRPMSRVCVSLSPSHLLFSLVPRTLHLTLSLSSPPLSLPLIQRARHCLSLSPSHLLLSLPPSRLACATLPLPLSLPSPPLSLSSNVHDAASHSRPPLHPTSLSSPLLSPSLRLFHRLLGSLRVALILSQLSVSPSNLCQQEQSLTPGSNSVSLQPVLVFPPPL